MSNGRDNFSPEIRRTLAIRAGGVCSFPGCHQLTIGPSLETPNKGIRNGIAAHIHAAAPGGPRYDPLQSAEARKSIENAIWMCPTHGNLIDKEKTVFTPDEIRQWKVEAESRARERLELSTATAQSGQEYTKKDAKILRVIAEKMPYDDVIRLKNEVFGARVPTAQIDSLFDIWGFKGNPEYEFNSSHLQTLLTTLYNQIECFHQHFSRHSAGNVGHYDYIHLADWSKHGSENRELGIKEINKARILANAACETLLQFLKIKSNLNGD